MVTGLRPGDLEDAYPLSQLQVGMLFHSEYNPQTDLAVYHDIFSFHLRTVFNLEALQTAIQQLVARHPVLRTSFDLNNFSQPVQLVHDKVDIPLIVEDMRALSPTEQEIILGDWMKAEKSQPFDWTKPPLLHFQIHRRTEETFQFAVSFHHAILDGWSVASMLTELFQIYLSLLDKDVPPIKPLPTVAFRDFVASEQKAIESEEHRRYWAERLKGCTVTTIPRWPLTGQISNLRQVLSHDVPLSAELFDGLKRLARSAGIPLKSALLTAHLWVLSWLSGQSDVLTGLLSHGRPEEPGSERVLGLFLNTLPFRLELSGDTWMDLLQQTYRVEQEMLPFRLYPLAELQKMHDGQPLFETAFKFVHFHVYRGLGEFADIQLLGGKFHEKTNFTFGATFSQDLYQSQLSLTLDYDNTILCEEQVKAIGGYYARALIAMVSDPMERYTACSPLSKAEQHQLLVEWNATQTDHPANQCIHKVFEEWVERTPDAVAVISEDQYLTYCELDRLANQLAHYLQRMGLKPYRPVGIYMKRSLETMISILGTLKTGGTYVPLDITYPLERLAFMLADTQPPVLLTKAHLEEKLPERNAQVICLDTDWESIAQESRTNPTSVTTVSNLAYVIYTSGSTGQPKGVLVPHRGLPNVVEAMVQTFDLTTTDRVLQFSSLSFDASVYDILLALGGGATLCLAQESLLPGMALSRWLRDVGVTIIPLTASALAALPDEGLSTLRIVISGAEPCPTELVSRWLENGRRFFNVYGPTEATIWATVEECFDNGQKPAIGRPISNVQIYVLDSRLLPVPIGVAGEMHIGGVSLTQGYLNSPALTAERFIPHPFSQEPGGRLYKTGDLARYLPDGRIDLLGRVDQQVKVRGFRIELGEVEVALRQHSAVQEAVVVAREDIPGDKQLVAYIVPQEGQMLAVSELSRFLKEKLPAYMVPLAFMMLQALPLTRTGKVDRRALFSLDIARPKRDGDQAAPRTPVEELLAALWTQVLNVERVGIHDNFFELGGHSLLATQLVSRIRETFKVEMPLRTLFESPTVAGLAAQIELARRAGQDLSMPPLKPVAREGELPLSFAQQRLWFLDQLEPGSSAYNIPAAVRLTGPLDVMTLMQSLNEIVRRHEALRTTFAMVDGRAIQIIAPATPVLLPIVGFQELSKARREAEAQQLAIKEAQRPFDLACGPLVRTTLLRMDEKDHVLLLTMHHIISDGWSMGVFIREAATLYEVFIAGEPSPLSELPIQYADFAVWQRQWLQGEVLEAQLAYWKEHLGGALGALELPTDRPRPPIQTFHGAAQSLALSRELSEALRELSQQEGVTLFMALLAAFKTLLYRYTGQEDILVGSPIANRNWPDIEGLIGFFVNTLVLRTDLSGTPSFRELLGRVREMALGAYAHQDMPFETLVDELQPERDLSRTPLFQVMFVLLNMPMGALELPDLILSPLEADSKTAKFDLTLSIAETKQGLRGTFEYNTDLFEAATMARMSAHFQTLLESIVADPGQHLAEFLLLTEAERQQLLVEWNDTQSDYPQDQCIHELFETQAEWAPNAVAVVIEAQQVTYQELNCRANQLAYRLQGLGVGPEVLVGICLERSLEMVVGLLGVLKAGGAYVPLDPTYPKERLAFMLADARVSVLLSQQHLVTNLPTQDVQIICLESGEEKKDSDQVWATQPSSRVSAANLAYVIYTSGSTGRPKGVGITHQSAVAFLSWAQTVFPLADLAGVLAATSICFDLSVFELFAPLSVGGTVILATHALQLPHLPTVTQVRLINTVPSAMAELIRLGGVPASVRTANLAGEPLPLSLTQQLYAQEAIQQVYNLYGPSEDTTYSTYALVPKCATNTPPIGRPISNAQVYVLDQYLQPVPIGAAGEVHIGGDGLARGYLNRPELTAGKLIPDPFSTAPGARLYKTGDLVRYWPNGNMEFLGRIDHQVKIRGFRIELGEVEAALGKHPTVQEAVVVAREDKPGHKRLVAYVVPSPGQVPTINELHRFLKAQLPDYMVPSAIVWMEVLPLTPNGKVDRRALPTPDQSRPELEDAFVAPRTPIEEVLAEIWAKVLQLDQIGVYDNFFELGGDSILSIQIIAKANQAGLRLMPKHIFQRQTIAELAAVESQSQAAQAEQDTVIGQIPLTPIQRQFLEQNFVDPHHQNQAVLFEARQALDPTLSEQVVRHLLMHHDTLRLRFTGSESGWQQFNAGVDENTPFVCVDLVELPLLDRSLALEAAAIQLQTSLDLTNGPLVRVALFDFGPGQADRLLFIIHHLAVDGVSWRIILEDVQALYQQLKRGEAIRLPPKTTSFKEWATRLAIYAQSEAIHSEASYWLTELQKEYCPLPLDKSGGANTIHSMRGVQVSLGREETRSLLQQVPEAYHTHIDEVLLTALVQAFAQWTGKRSLFLELEGHGREILFESVDLSRTVGWFTSVFPVRLDLGADPFNPGEALKVVKEQLRHLPRRGIGYGLLRYLSRDEKIIELLRAEPQAEVSFNYLGQFDQVLEESALFRPAQENSGPPRSWRGKRNHLLDINSLISNGQLQMVFYFSENRHNQSTIERLAQGFMARLRALITHCLSPQTGDYTPSDFPVADLSQTELDRIMAQLDNVEE